MKQEWPPPKRRYPSGAPCPVCAWPYREWIDSLLVQEHSYACIAWEMRRRSIHIFSGDLRKHHKQHCAFFTGYIPSPPEPSRWWYLAPWPDTETYPAPLEMIIVRGLPGTGKSRMAADFALTHRHLEADHFFLSPYGRFHHATSLRRMAYLWCRDEAIITLREKVPVVIANTFVSADSLVGYVAMAHHFGVPMRIIEMPDTLPRTLREAKAQDSTLFEHVNISLIGKMRHRWESLPFAVDDPCISLEMAPTDLATRPPPVWEAERAKNAASYRCHPGICRHAPVFDFAQAWLRLQEERTAENARKRVNANVDDIS